MVRPPTGRAAFFLFLTVNLGSAFFNIITDCDEVGVSSMLAFTYALDV